MIPRNFSEEKVKSMNRGDSGQCVYCDSQESRIDKNEVKVNKNVLWLDIVCMTFLTSVQAGFLQHIEKDGVFNLSALVIWLLSLIWMCLFGFKLWDQVQKL